MIHDVEEMAIIQCLRVHLTLPHFGLTVLSPLVRYNSTARDDRAEYLSPPRFGFATLPRASLLERIGLTPLAIFPVIQFIPPRT